jgi:O-antigen ligase
MKARLVALRQFFSLEEWMFAAFGLVTMFSIWLSIRYYMEFLIGIPAVLLITYWCIVDFKRVFFVLFACIPISIEYFFPNGYATDLPTEPLIVGLMLVATAYFLKHFHAMRGDFFKHPITILLLLHVSWTLITMTTSMQFVYSLKFFIAKIWYVVTFYFLGSKLMRTEDDLKTFVRYVGIPLVFIVLVCIVRHARLGFTFEEVNFALSPFFRNHVSYASVMALFFPFLWIATTWYPRWTKHWNYTALGALVLLIGIQFSYTRAAYGAILLALGAYYIIRWRLMKYVLLLVVTIFTLSISALLSNNKYLDFAPDYSKTIMHKSFDNLLEATYKLQDISTMERVYRWVAAFRMIDERPMMGVGPGNFYSFYKNYTVHKFETYVSDNPEQSGVHSYYLMVTVEQGVIGLFIFLVLNLFIFLKIETIYHASPPESGRRKMVLMAGMCFVIIQSLLLMNDLIETDKTGSFYYICIAILVNMDIANKRELQLSDEIS